MPRYFFQINQGQHSVKPLQGLDLPDDEAAWEEATTACGEMIRDLDGELKAGPEWRMEVTDETGHLLYRLRFTGEAFEKKK